MAARRGKISELDRGFAPTQRNREIGDNRAAEARAIDRGQTVPDDLQLEVAVYIEGISSELRLMARSARLEALAYFLEMARLEASIQIERQSAGRSG